MHTEKSRAQIITRHVHLRGIKNAEPANMTAAIHFLYQYQWLVGLHGTNRFLKKFTTHTQWSCHCCYRLFAHLAVGLKSSTRTRVQPTCTHSCKSFILVCVRACAGSNCTNKENLKQNVQNSDNNLRFHVVSHGVVVDNRTPQWMETKVQQTIMSWISRKKLPQWHDHPNHSAINCAKIHGWQVRITSRMVCSKASVDRHRQICH